MSEEILKALMQLYAIIAKQDDGVNDIKKNYVKSFLSQQISEDKVATYFALFNSFISEDDEAGADDGKVKRTSVKDSVRTLGITKKIGKSLTQKQKIIVLVRLFELINSDKNFSEQRVAIIDTVAKVFKIKDDEYQAIENFIVKEDFFVHDSTNTVLIGANCPVPDFVGPNFMHYPKLNGRVKILNIASVGLFFLAYDGDIEVQLNGNTIKENRIYLLANGSTLRLPVGKPVYYSEIFNAFAHFTDDIALSFDVNNISYQFQNGNIGLRNISISEREGNLVGIMGASGAGKTTLLSLLSGTSAPSDGEVLINGINLHQNAKQLEGLIGYVPQDDLLFENLTVFQNLYYNAKICFNNLTEEEIVEKVNTTLESLGLAETANLKVGSVRNKTISGGQRKRLNIALEFIREPGILFLDEPTSGLSSKDSENVLDLLRELAYKGKLIFVVIHQPSSDIYKMFDKMLILDTGGYQVFYGNPVEAVSYFKKIDHQVNSEAGECVVCGTVNPETIFNILESKEIDEYGNLTNRRKIKPESWGELYKQNIKPTKVESVKSVPPKTLHIVSKIKQYSIFFLRDFYSKISNRQYILLNILEAPVLAFILSLIIRHTEYSDTLGYTFMYNNNIAAYVFMSIIVALFLGLSVSAEEIFRDKIIRKREYFLNLSTWAYISSKTSLLLIISAIQSLLFMLVGNLILEFYGYFFEMWFMLFTVSAFANLLGLTISSIFNSAVTIYIMIPLLIIPQMVLGGAMFPYYNLNTLIGGGEKNNVPALANALPARWAYEAIITDLYVNNPYGQVFYTTEQVESKCNFQVSYRIPLLKTTLNEINSALRVDPSDATISDKLHLLRNEAEEENKNNPKIKFEDFEAFTAENLTDYYYDLEDYYNELNDFYSIVLKNVLAKKEDLKGTVNYEELRQSYFNEYVNELVINSMMKSKILVLENKIVQKVDPVYLVPPKSTFGLDAHFYAPKKSFFGSYLPTFWFNSLYIWLFTILLYATVYVLNNPKISKFNK